MPLGKNETTSGTSVLLQRQHRREEQTYGCVEILPRWRYLTGVEWSFAATGLEGSMVPPRPGGATVGVRGALPTADQQSTLADRIRIGEPSAEEELVHLFRDRIAFLARMRTHDAGVAQDLTQDVLLAVVVALRDGHLRNPDRLAAFVYGTARNVINNHLRARSRQPTESPLSDRDRPASPQNRLEAVERSALVRRALVSLDSVDRHILLLTLVNGLKPGEIADRLGLTSEVVRARKCRALKRITERVKNLSRP